MINAKKNTVLLPLLFGLLNICKFDAFSEATDVFGKYDDRIQYYKLDDATNEKKWAQNKAYFKELASGVCLITDPADITSDGGSTTKSRLYLYGTLSKAISDKYNGTPTCDVLKFKNEFVVRISGTGSLIDNRKVLTAKHVSDDIESGEKRVCVFNYYKETETSLPSKWDSNKQQYYCVINTSDIYPVAKVIHLSISGGRDWAVVELDKDVAATQKRLCYYKDTDIQDKIGVGSDGKELCALGFPSGLPLTFTDDGRQTNKTGFLTDLDLFQGNSGCPILVAPSADANNEYKYKIIALCSNGGTDWQLIKQNDGGTVDNKPCDCYKEYYKGDPAINGGGSSKITSIPMLLNVPTVVIVVPFDIAISTEIVRKKETNLFIFPLLLIIC